MLIGLQQRAPVTFCIGLPFEDQFSYLGSFAFVCFDPIGGRKLRACNTGPCLAAIAPEEDATTVWVSKNKKKSLSVLHERKLH